MTTPPTPGPEQPARVLGPMNATAIVVGAVIGVGIFFNPSQVASLTRSADLSLLAWGVAGAIALCGALTFAGLGTRYNRNGAQYEVLRDAYGPFAGFLFVVCNATAIQASAAAVIAVVCVKHLAGAAGVQEPSGFEQAALAGLLITGVLAANVVGVRWGSGIQTLSVWLKVLTLLLVGALAIVAAPDAPDAGPVEFVPPATVIGKTGAVLAALVPCLFAYGGWQHSLWISGEVRHPERNLPRAIIGGMLLVVAVYVFANWAYLRLLGVHAVAVSGTLAADAVAVIWPVSGRRLIATGVAASAFGVLNAQLLSGPRLVYGMARDGRFFRPFARLSPRFGTPVWAIVLIGVMAVVLLAVSGNNIVKRLTTVAVYIDAVFFALTGAAVFILRRRTPSAADGPGAPRPLRVIGHPFAPALFVIGELGVLAGAFLAEDVLIATLVGTGWIFGAAVVYVVFFSGGAASRTSVGTDR